MKETRVPINPNDWTVADWRDLWNGIEQVRESIAARHSSNTAPPVDNDHVETGCERFSDSIEGETPKLIRDWRWALYDACLEIEKLPASEQETKCVGMVSTVAHQMQQFLIDRGLYLGRTIPTPTP